MTADLQEVQVIHNIESHRFEIQIEGHVAVLNYRRFDETVLFTHTGVPSAIEGRGLGNRLVRAGLEYARENKFKILSTCWFVDRYLQRHPEFAELQDK